MPKSYSTYSLFLLVSLFTFSCGSTLKVSEDSMEEGKYQEVIDRLTVFTNQKPNSPEAGKANYLIAESYRLSNRIAQALPFYEKALKNDYYTENDEYYYAFALKANGQYLEAAQALNNYLKNGSDYELRRRAREELKNLNDIEGLSRVNPFVVLKGLELNTTDNEYGPFLYNDSLIFTADWKATQFHEATGTGFSDFHVVALDTAGLPTKKVKSFMKQFHEEGRHEALVTISPAGDRIIFARSNSTAKKDKVKEVNLFESRLQPDGKWSEPEILDISEENYWDSSPFISPDGETLYFASDRPGGYGGVDLYRATLSPDGEWEKVINLGRTINTKGNEIFPYVSSDRKLYFASDGQPGLGQLDLFIAERVGGKTTIRNLGAPFNTNYDDFALTQLGSRKGYFSSNRPGIEGVGNDNILFFNDTTPNEKPVLYLLAGRSILDEADGDVLLPNTKLILEDTEGMVLDSTRSDTAGVYTFAYPLSLDTEYYIRGEKEPYIAGLTPFSTKDKAADPYAVLQAPGDTAKITFRTDVVLEPDLFANLSSGMEEVELRGITYAFDKSELTEQAKLILNKLVIYLKENPEIAVELGSHTDARGPYRYNMRLSKKRAESSRDYLIFSGIDPGRIVSRGFGESNLKVPDAQTEEEHELNRRTTVRIIN